MTAKELAQCCAREKDDLVRLYMTRKDSVEGLSIAVLNLSPAKKAQCRAILDNILTDAFYTVLLALDGAASLGGKQETYSLRDERGRELTGGDLEAHAWECFHGPGAKKRGSRRTRKRR